MSEREIPSPTKQRTRLNIIRASKNLFDKHGIENTSIMLIANECNITRRTVYDHFQDKSAIVFLILGDYFSELYTLNYQECEKMQGVLRLKKVLHIVFDKYLDNPIIMRFLINYYQMNPNQLSDEEKILNSISSIQKVQNFINLPEIDNCNLEKYQHKVEIVLQYILGVGMRYSLRNSSFLGFKHNVTKEELHTSLDALLTIFDK